MWIEPKTNWSKNDRFNIEDFNRIKNNINVLSESVAEIYRQLELIDMGTDILSYSEYWDFQTFNAFERNLEKLSNEVGLDYGQGQTFYANGVFINYVELNRIENALFEMKRFVDWQKATIPKIPFNLGRYREVRA